MSNLGHGIDATVCQVTIATENNSANLHVQIHSFSGGCNFRFLGLFWSVNTKEWSFGLWSEFSAWIQNWPKEILIRDDDVNFYWKLMWNSLSGSWLLWIAALNICQELPSLYRWLPRKSYQVATATTQVFHSNHTRLRVTIATTL